MTKPIRSLCLSLINSDATFFAASKRVGEKSFAIMVPDISNAIIMSIPSDLDISEELTL